jgi:cytoskeletal protein CcmA (bactofilin family)
MFRRKEEDTIEELSVMVSDNNSDQQNRTDVALSSANPVNRTQTVPASATPVVGSYRPASSTAQVASPMRPSSAAPRPAGGGAFSPADAAIRSASSNEDPRQSPVGSGKNNKRVLTVGNDILLKGEIATCDRLVIEGMVDAILKDVHTVEISETGSFKGTAEIQDAEISGLFEGDLIVRNRLTIYSTGKVRGKISYGEIEIERGGQMTGEIRISGESDAAEKNKKNAA